MKKHLIRLLIFVLTACLLAAPVSAEQYGATFQLSSGIAAPGELVNIRLTVSGATSFNAIGLYDLKYDPAVLTFVGFDNYSAIESKCAFSGGFDDANQAVVLALNQSEVLSGYICNIRFRVNANAPSTITRVEMSSLVRENSTDIPSTVLPGDIQIGSSGLHTHSLVKTEALAANCHAVGNVAFWTCTTCGKNYNDAEGNLELASVTLPINPANHDGGTRVNSTTGATVCLGCGAVVSPGTVVTPGGGVTPPPTGEGTTNTQTPNTPADDLNTSTDSNSTQNPETPENESSDGEETSATEWKNPFVDVSSDDEHYDAIRFVYENDLFKGISDTEFAPDVTMTRAMFVTVLGRLSEVDTAYYGGDSYADVVLGEWYAPFVKWASEENLVLGYGNGEFGVNDEISIEAAAVIMQRYAAYIGSAIGDGSGFENYVDANEISYWAVEAMKWIVESGIYEPNSNKLEPSSQATRSLVAEMLYRFATQNAD